MPCCSETSNTLWEGGRWREMKGGKERGRGREEEYYCMFHKQRENWIAYFQLSLAAGSKSFSLREIRFTLQISFTITLWESIINKSSTRNLSYYSWLVNCYLHEFFKGEQPVSRGVVELEDELAAELSTESTMRGGRVHAAQTDLQLTQGETCLIRSQCPVVCVVGHALFHSCKVYTTHKTSQLCSPIPHLVVTACVKLQTCLV